MQLAEYLALTGMSQSEFARASGIPQQDINKYARSRTLPRPARIAQIARATRGKVSAADWYAQREGAAA